ncbi:MAG: metal-dependent transcriptional regulator [Desulfobacteraceae bacterium]|nr:metal-dependent transcriptional regulator [Desulfobacteraceae bacterium]MBC2755427.1 metal-dependent transcriptional regulator [Desulfobacteraceae bacterium]
MKKGSGLSESLEDYLEVILDLEKTNKVARAKNIAERLDIKRGSVTGALKSLEEKGLVNYSPYSYITLTPKGEKIAREITRRHAGLRDFLYQVLQVDAETADATACRMEHVIDEQTMDRLMCFFDYIHSCPRTGPDWLENFTAHCSSKRHDWEQCDQCLSVCLARHRKKAGTMDAHE